MRIKIGSWFCTKMDGHWYPYYSLMEKELTKAGIKIISVEFGIFNFATEADELSAINQFSLH